MEWIENLHPVAQVVATIGLFTVIGIAVYGFFKLLSEM